MNAVSSFVRTIQHNNINGKSFGWESYFRCGTQLLTKMSTLLSKSPAAGEALGIYIYIYMDVVYDLSTNMQLIITNPTVYSIMEKSEAQRYKAAFGQTIAFVHDEIFTDALNQLSV